MICKKILVVEDDPEILKLLQWHLKNEGYTILSSQNGRTGLQMAIDENPDLIILDLMLPEIDGLEICKSLKKQNKTERIPVLMLTAKGEEIDRVVGFEVGADDYVIKPFSPRELMLRIRAIFKRIENLPENQSELRYESLRIDPETYRVWIDEQEIYLTITEFKLLFELLSNIDKVRTRDQLLDRVWGYSFEGYARTVDTHVRRLRQKLGDYSIYIDTVRGIGYRFSQKQP